MLNHTIDMGRAFLGQAGLLSSFMMRLVRASFDLLTDRKALKLEGSLLTEQMETIGVRSLSVVLITALFTGMVLALQASDSLEKVLKGISQFIGRTVALPFIRELGPVLTALIVTGRIGSSIAAEIGTMQVTEQIDALKTLGAPPMRYLGAPRFIACVTMLPALTVIAMLMGLLGGWLVAVATVGVSTSTYFGDIPQMVVMADVWKGLLKTPFFGAIIAGVACYQGFNTHGGAEGVGHATTRAVVWASILILVADYFLTAIFLVLF
jgi:phospholipid/cholesterol/gamma-HCH transport system permease protein